VAANDTTPKPPAHVAIIMDGNGRWATRRGMPRLFGHRAGAARVRDIVAACPDLGITALTLFAFSTENWRRSAAEVRGLMALFRRYISTETVRLHASDVRVRFIGDRERLDGKLVRLMQGLEDKTRDNRGLRLTVALNYGARDEMARAQRRLLAALAAGQVAPGDVGEATLGRFLDTGDLPDVDLVIRTSGERRISNFLLWQSAYAEYDFVDTLWPDFTPADLERSLDRFQTRERRFGAVAG
jgi:undecaprenyl diphosphate synthase